MEYERTMTRTDLLIALAAIAVAVALMCGCVKGDLNVYYGGRQMAQVSNVSHKASAVVADIDAAKTATPKWFSKALEVVAESVGLPGAAGGGLAVVLTGVWMRMRANRKKEKRT